MLDVAAVVVEDVDKPAIEEVLVAKASESLPHEVFPSDVY